MKVLVVDDSPDAAEPLIAFLHHCGYQTSVAHNATDALHIAATFQPDLALLDIGMPGLDGWVLGGLLRGLPGLSDLPIIAVTGYGLPEHRQLSAEANFQHHLVKPVDYAALAVVMKAHEPASDEPARPASADSPVAAPTGTPVAPSVACPPPVEPDVSDG